MDPAAMIFTAPDNQAAITKPKRGASRCTYMVGPKNKHLVESLLAYNGIVKQTTGNDFVLCWTTSSYADRVNPVSVYQRINHFPHSKKTLGNKAKLASMIQKNPHYSEFEQFLPLTFQIPQDRDALYKYMKAHPGHAFIAKPISGSCGQGIRLIHFSDYYSLLPEHIVCQYIDRPLCIDGFKFDLRVYVLVTSYAPLRAFVAKEGLARFATEVYSTSTSNRMSILTNSSLNKHSTHYSNDFKWKLSEVLSEIEHRWGKTQAEMRSRIEKVIHDTLVLIQPTMAPPRRFDHRSNFFELYGYDILIDRDFKMWLLEINTNPLLSCEAAIDYAVKSKVVAGALSIAGIYDGKPADITDDCQFIAMEDYRNEQSGNVFNRIFPDPSVDQFLAHPSIEKPEEINKLTNEQAREVLLRYLNALDKALKEPIPSRIHVERIQNFLLAQGYTNVRSIISTRAQLRTFIDRFKRPRTAMPISIPSYVQLQADNLNASYIGKLLTGVKISTIKKLGTLFV